MADEKKKDKDQEKKKDALKKETDLDWLEWGLDSPLAADKLKDTDTQKALPKQEPPPPPDPKKKK